MTISLIFKILQDLLVKIIVIFVKFINHFYLKVHFLVIQAAINSIVKKYLTNSIEMFYFGLIIFTFSQFIIFIYHRLYFFIDHFKFLGCSDYVVFEMIWRLS